MNLICPHCEKMITVPESEAGQSIRCPECKETLNVPALAAASLPLEIPDHIGLSSFEDPSSNPSPEPGADRHSTYSLAPEQARPTTSPPPSTPRRTDRERSGIGQAPSPKAANLKAPLSPPIPPAPTGYEHEFVFGLNHLVVPWIAPACLALVFFLWFFPWVGLYPGDYSAYTQTPFQAIVGSFSFDPVAEKVMKMEEQIRSAIHLSGLSLLQLVILLAALVLAVVPFVSGKMNIAFPPVVQHLLQWRVQILAATCGVLFLLLLWQTRSGFGLENAATYPIDERFKESLNAARTPEDAQQLAIRRGLELGKLNIQHTAWLSLAGFLVIVAAGSALLEMWLARRGGKPLPLVQVHW
jgi:hypothetical protein